jgi:hypothetical protein
MNQEVHTGGMFASVGLAGLATVGANLTTFRGIGRWDVFWIGVFVVAVLLLSAAIVNFDMKRWLW